MGSVGEDVSVGAATNALRVCPHRRQFLPCPMAGERTETMLCCAVTVVARRLPGQLLEGPRCLKYGISGLRDSVVPRAPEQT
jgi:hypothetical protein